MTINSTFGYWCYFEYYILSTIGSVGTVDVVSTKESSRLCRICSFLLLCVPDFQVDVWIVSCDIPYGGKKHYFEEKLK